MSAELFKAMTKCDMLHVPYRGSAAAFPDVISNKVQMIFDNLPTAMAQAKADGQFATADARVKLKRLYPAM